MLRKLRNLLRVLCLSLPHLCPKGVNQNLPRVLCLALPHLCVMFAILFAEASMECKLGSLLLFGTHMLVICFVAPFFERWLLQQSVNMLVERLDMLPSASNCLAIKAAKSMSKQDCIRLLTTLVVDEQSHIILDTQTGVFGLERKERYGNGPSRMIFIAKAKNDILVG